MKKKINLSKGNNNGIAQPHNKTLDLLIMQGNQIQ